jgi:capsular exopolysaccharide synthesis family protein
MVNPSSHITEAYRVLRNNLDFINFEDHIKVLLVASAEPSEGKSTVAANLAAVMAQAGRKVVLLNCDFHRPASEQFFDIDHSKGLSEVLRGALEIGLVLQKPTGFDKLWVLPAGSMPPNPSELLGSATMSNLVASLRDLADWVVVDTPPLLAVADAAATARWADGVLMVTRGGASTRGAAQRGREMLEKVGARILGVVVWGFELPVGGTGYLASYGYSAHHAEE